MSLKFTVLCLQQTLLKDLYSPNKDLKVPCEVYFYFLFTCVFHQNTFFFSIWPYKHAELISIYIFFNFSSMFVFMVFFFLVFSIFLVILPVEYSEIISRNVRHMHILEMLTIVLLVLLYCTFKKANLEPQKSVVLPMTS